jgi:predicted regulator of Ras-like GTPase activity (Roadblock/LC7/MglB family)
MNIYIMDLKDDRLFREIMTQVGGTRGVQLITREGVIIQSLFANNISGLDLSMLANSFLSVSEHILVTLNLADLKSGVLQADDGYFIVLKFETDCFLVINIVSNAPLNLMISQIMHTIERQVPKWRHEDPPKPSRNKPTVEEEVTEENSTPISSDENKDEDSSLIQ